MFSLTKGELNMSGFIEVVNGKGKRVKVTQKAFDIVYEGQGFKLYEEPELVEPVDLFTLSKEELEKINKPIIATFLDKKEIEYDPKATKDELIDLIVGE